MEFRTSSPFDHGLFNRLQNRLKDFSETKRRLKSDPHYYANIPSEINFQLTYECNLRCKMCYQWSKDGYFQKYVKELIKQEIDVDTIKKVLIATRSANSRLYLWGGEPMVHSQWSSIADTLTEDPRFTIMCTNGMLIEKNMESLKKISSHLVLLISIDGPSDIHNSLRGKNTFERLIKQVNLLLEEKRKGKYLGDVSANVVLTDELIPRLYDFVEYLEDLGLNSIYLNYPWYISTERAHAMDKFYADHLEWISGRIQPGTASWHSYTFKLSGCSEELLKEQIMKMNSRIWKTRVRFQQQLKMDEVSSFIDDTYQPNRQCLAIANRLEVLAEKKVGICSKFFPELAIGDLNKESVMDIWKGERFNKLRNVISKGLLPVCSKCVLLYRNGI